MDTVQVQYIGTKPVKEDNVAATGVVWLGEGDVQGVPLSAWPKLAPHTGIWRLVDKVAPVASRTLQSAASPAPAPKPAATALYGANLPALIDIGGVEVQLGAVVAAAHGHSGMTVDAWNALSESDRQDVIEAFIAQARAEAAEPKSKDDPSKTDKATQAPKALSYEELKDALTKAGVEFPKQAKKAVLQALYDEHTKARA